MSWGNISKETENKTKWQADKVIAVVNSKTKAELKSEKKVAWTGKFSAHSRTTFYLEISSLFQKVLKIGVKLLFQAIVFRWFPFLQLFLAAKSQ